MRSETCLLNGAWNEEKTEGRPGRIADSIVFAREEAEALKELVAGSGKLQEFYHARAQEALKADQWVRGAVLELAVAGYLLEEAGYSARAASLALRLTAVEGEGDSGCKVEASDSCRAGFAGAPVLTEVVLAMGFLGGVLEEREHGRITDAVEAAWRKLEARGMESGGRSTVNQRLWNSAAALLGAVYLQRSKGGFESAIRDCFRRHSEMVEESFGEEGVCVEGGGYFESLCVASGLLWHVYAQYTGRSWQEMVPTVFRRAGRCQEALMSVNSRRGRHIATGDSGEGELSTLFLVFMTLMCDFPEGNNYLIARLEGEEAEQAAGAFEMMLCRYYEEQMKLQPYYRKEEEEISPPGLGLLTYRRGSTKLFCGSPFHTNRGQIVLQAAGETLLPDLGAAAGSTACPADMDMVSDVSAAEAVPAKLVSHEVKEDGYHFNLETGMLYGDDVRGNRQGFLGRDGLQVIDSWHFTEPHSLMVTYLSYAPWEVRPAGREAVSGRMTLTVESCQPVSFEVEEAVGSDGRTGYILRIVAEAWVDQRVVGSITWRPKELSTRNSGWENRLALQEMLDRGGSVRIEETGTYEIEDTLYIKSHTHLFLGKGVALKRAASSVGSFLLINRGAFSRTWDSDITVEGLNLIVNGVEARHHAAVYGLTGEISFFYVKRLRVFDFTCTDLPRLSFGLHICTFEDIILERLHVEGRKDAVHLGTGKRFVIRHGIFRTYDDPIALNAHDYAVANPQMGWIEDGLVEDCYDLPDKDTTGYFCRILAGSWVDWYQGMEIQNSDTVVSNGRVYRAFQNPDGRIYKSMTAPDHEEGMRTLEGINWVMVQEEVVYNCGCRNLHFKDIHLQKARGVALSIHYDHDQYSRSVYPGSHMPVQENIVFENVIVQNDTACLVRSITPVDTVKICNSVIGTPKRGNSSIRLEILPGWADCYPETQILLLGNTCYGDPGQIVQCGKGRTYQIVAVGNLRMPAEGEE